MTGHSEEEDTSHFMKQFEEKRVSFPPDEEMVSTFVESRDELQEGKLLTCYYSDNILFVNIYYTN